MDDSFVPKFKSVRKMFGEDEVCYIMDAKNTGNIGRFLNVSVIYIAVRMYIAVCMYVYMLCVTALM